MGFTCRAATVVVDAPDKQKETKLVEFEFLMAVDKV